MGGGWTSTHLETPSGEVSENSHHLRAASQSHQRRARVGSAESQQLNGHHHVCTSKPTHSMIPRPLRVLTFHTRRCPCGFSILSTKLPIISHPWHALRHHPVRTLPRSGHCPSILRRAPGCARPAAPLRRNSGSDLSRGTVGSRAYTSLLSPMPHSVMVSISSGTSTLPPA